MAKRTIITNKGFELLATSSKVSGQYYWIGYYSLAYVPNIWKSNQVELPECTPDGVTIDDIPYEPLTPSMTKITESGDIIYNIFQGDLVGTGYAHGTSDGSPGGNLFGLSLYNKSIKKHYRYVLDENGNNNLIAWENDLQNTALGLMKGAAIYKGTNGFEKKSEIPIPAPLYYLGDITGKLSVHDFFPDITNQTINGASIYLSTTYVYGTNSTEFSFPLVSADFRGYLDSQGNDSTAPYSHQIKGSQFDSLEIAAAVDSGFNETSWFSADSTRVTDVVGAYTGKISDTLWKLVSISNYNRFHAPTNSIGYVLDSDLANKNISKITKFFPISNYKVISSVSSSNREIATGLALTIDINLAPNVKTSGFDDETSEYDETSNLTLFNKYVRDDIVQDDIYNTTHISFKFNRIGLYAVPLMGAPYTSKPIGVQTKGTACEIQFQINPDVEPILFAVIDFDNTIYLSDTGDGLHRFRGEININLSNDSGVDFPEDSSLIRDAVIFYNLYQDDALTWYQNQLIATASTQNAIIELGLEIAHLKTKINDIVCCQSDLYNNYLNKNENYGKPLRNLLDAFNALDGGLRGIDTKPDNYRNDPFNDDNPYFVGNYAFVLGTNTFAQSPYSFVNGNENRIIGGEYISELIPNNKNNSEYSSILNGTQSYIYNSKFSLLGTTNICGISIKGDIDSYGENNVILSGIGNFIDIEKNISSGVSENIILCGRGNSIVNSHGSSIINTNGTIIDKSQYSCTIDGNQHKINKSFFSTIINGNSNTIDEFGYSIIGTGSENKIEKSLKSIILNGHKNLIKNSNDSIILGGEKNNIYGGSTIFVYGDNNNVGIQNYINANVSFYIGIFGINNEIKKSVYGNVLGYNNKIEDSENFIVDGFLHEIKDSNNTNILCGINNTVYYGNIFEHEGYNSIVNGNNNNLYITAFSSIINGENNKIHNNSDLIYPLYSLILNGKDCVVEHYGEISRSNGLIKGNDSDVVTIFDYNNNNEPVKFIGSDNIYASSKNSSFMFSCQCDAWKNFNVNSDGVILNTLGTDLVELKYYPTLDGKPLLFENGIVKNTLNLKNGESISGILKVMIHTPYSKAGSICLGSGGDQLGSGFVYYSLISFGAHRDGYGRIVLSSQLLNESASSISKLPVDSYGVNINLRTIEELGSFIDNESYTYKKSNFYVDEYLYEVSCEDDPSSPNLYFIVNLQNHGLKTGDFITIKTSNIPLLQVNKNYGVIAMTPDVFRIIKNPQGISTPGNISFVKTKSATVKSFYSLPDDHNDFPGHTNFSGSLLIEVKLNLSENAIYNLFTSRYFYVNAVIDSLIISTETRLYPPTQTYP